ncbi:MAG: N-acetylmuramoyl-L-alanine amidase [Desulforhopalus sp.]|nr:N-acetylmuramoyl-L-alanine amidase [Desulforhopalus sp.]
MIRTAVCISLLIFSSLLCVFPAFGQLADDDRDKPLPVGRLYDEAKFYYNQLQTNSKLASSRDNWLKGTRNFRRIYLSNPKSEIAPSCLFMLGRLYCEIYDRFQNGLDLDEAITYFSDITKNFPQHRLADDALLSLGQIYLDKKHNPQQAADFLSEIVTNYSNGDMHPDAENLLKVLSLEHDIALPKVMVSSSRDNKLNYVLPVKYWSSDNYTRVVIMASGPVNYKEILLEETENSPRRLYIDFKKSYIEPQYRAPVPIEDGLLKRIRTGQFSPDTVRVVLDIESIGSYKIYSLPDPFRVVIDVRGEKLLKEIPQTASAAINEKQPAVLPSPASNTNDRIVILRDNKKIAINTKHTTENVKVEAVPAVKPLSLAQQLGLGVKKIVLDPGHGGKDPGAMSFGLKEKDIVLDIAKKLAPALKKELGCDVVLTRKDDSFISLEERTAIANTNSADLFISLHINAHQSSKVRGLETYYLNLTTNAEAMRVAARENATSTHQMSELQDILSDIMKNSKIDESSRLAQQVHNSILSEGDKKGFSDIKNLGVKQAPFYVLIGAQMPAILIELAFISNEKDVENLKSTAFIDMLTKEISDGVRAYISDTTASK